MESINNNPIKQMKHIGKHNGHEYVDFGIRTKDGKRLLFATEAIKGVRTAETIEQKWGGKWRMPTTDEIKLLIHPCCTMTFNEKNGNYLVSGKKSFTDAKLILNKRDYIASNDNGQNTYSYLLIHTDHKESGKINHYDWGYEIIHEDYVNKKYVKNFCIPVFTDSKTENDNTKDIYQQPEEHKGYQVGDMVGKEFERALHGVDDWFYQITDIDNKGIYTLKRIKSQTVNCLYATPRKDEFVEEEPIHTVLYRKENVLAERQTYKGKPAFTWKNGIKKPLFQHYRKVYTGEIYGYDD